MEQMKQRLIYALDAAGFNLAEEQVEQLSDLVGVFKIGKQLFVREGPAVVRMVQSLGGKVFLDLKFHDIPFTVAEAAAAASRLQVEMFNVHALGGRAMMAAARQAVDKAADEQGRPGPKVLAVTILTSLADKDLAELGLGKVQETVLRLAALAQKAGLDGVVASPQEVAAIRKECGPDFLIVVPGVRPSGGEVGDQKRVMTPAEAIRAGADYLVVGRPIREAKDPRAQAQAILEEMAFARQDLP
jgi:orotidine-5'-phosphate decarboxylase